MTNLVFEIPVEVKAEAKSTAPALTREIVEATARLADELPNGELRNGVYALIRFWREQHK